MQKPRARRSAPSLPRRRWTEKEARQVLAALARSGLTLTAFAIGEGLDPQRLLRWRRRLRLEGVPTFEEVLPPAPTALLGGHAEAGAAQERFEILFPSGRLVRVPPSFDPAALRRLLSVVEEGPAC